ncbi:hypothetical protein XENTR_v10022471 [Xenopus tropicalis]|nr:hypothetical protein XENTR_v10022471 [Xenopus tropicalis]
MGSYPKLYPSSTLFPVFGLLVSGQNWGHWDWFRQLKSFCALNRHTLKGGNSVASRSPGNGSSQTGMSPIWLWFSDEVGHSHHKQWTCPVIHRSAQLCPDHTPLLHPILGYKSWRLQYAA